MVAILETVALVLEEEKRVFVDKCIMVDSSIFNYFYDRMLI